MRYLDPKNDLTFKKVFGQHPHLLRSFLNALLPLKEGQQIEHIEYIPAELVPEIPLLKNSVVDVRCTDNRGRQFIVEMQMLWTDSFKNRVLFNASKAYVKQLDRGHEYILGTERFGRKAQTRRTSICRHEVMLGPKLLRRRHKGLKPVYALSLVNENFEPGTPAYYHHYAIVHTQFPERRIDGLQLIFVELPKFKAQNLTEKKLQVLWLRYLTEIEDGTEHLPADLLEIPEVREAIEYLQESAFTKQELVAYDKYWDSVSSERTLIEDAYSEGQQRGEQKGERQQAIAMARRMKTKGFDTATIAELTGLSVAEVEQL